MAGCMVVYHGGGGGGGEVARSATPPFLHLASRWSCFSGFTLATSNQRVLKNNIENLFWCEI